VEAIQANEGTQVPKPAPDPAKTGFVFTGWYNTETGGTLYAWPHTLNANVTMHARWTPVYTVTFHPEGGGPAPDTRSVAEGGAVGEPAAMTRESSALPSRAGLYLNPKDVFGGWYTESAYTTPYDFTAPVTGSLDLYAKWTEPVPG
jgi:uncharacterized repeat protein (TIGR02543 family)